MRSSMLAFGVLALLACGEPSGPETPPETPPEAPPAPAVRPAPPTSAAVGSTDAPDGYPEDFPHLPGGHTQPAPPGPPGLRMFTIIYPQSPAELDGELRSRVEAMGWTISSAATSPRGNRRMTSTRGTRSVRTSILPGPSGGGSALLLMP